MADPFKPASRSKTVSFDIPGDEGGSGSEPTRRNLSNLSKTLDDLKLELDTLVRGQSALLLMSPSSQESWKSKFRTFCETYTEIEAYWSQNEHYGNKAGQVEKKLREMRVFCQHYQWIQEPMCKIIAETNHTQADQLCRRIFLTKADLAFNDK